MADVKVKEISTLSYFASCAETHINAVHNAAQYILHQLLTNLEDSKDTVNRIKADLKEMLANYNEEDDYAPIAAREENLREAKEALSSLKSVYSQLLDVTHNGVVSITSLTGDATDFISRYSTYLSSL